MTLKGRMETFAEALKRVESEATAAPAGAFDRKPVRMVDSAYGRSLNCARCSSVFHNTGDRNCPERAR